MLFTFGSIVLTTEGKKENTYELAPNGKVYIKEIWINGSNKNLKTFASDYNLTYDDNTNYINVNKDFKLKLPSIYEFNIIFKTTSNSGSISIKNNKNEEILDLKSDVSFDYCYITNNTEKTQILKQYIDNDFKFVHLIIILLSGIIYFISMKIIELFIIKIKENNLNIRHILLYFISSFILIINSIYLLIEALGRFSVFLYFIPMLFGLYLLKDNLKDRLHYVFIYLMIPLGILFGLCLPIDHVPDENSHFYKSFIYSKNIMNQDIDEDNDYCIGDYVSINKVISEYNYDVLNPNYTLKARAFYANYLKKYSNKIGSATNCYYNVANLPFIAYTFTTISLVFTQLLNMPILLMYILGRMMNLLVYMLIIYYCLKKIPKYKKALLIISTLPIALQSAIGYNQDCIHNALFILLFTKIVQAINRKEKLNLKEMLTIIIISILLGLCKLGYFPIIFMCLLIPKDRFINIKDNILKKSILIMPILIVFVILYFSFWNTGGSKSSLSNVYSIYYFFIDPVDFIRLYLNTVRVNGFYMTTQGLTDGFGWSTKYNSTVVSYIISGSYTLLLFTGVIDKKNKINYNLITLFSAFFIILLIMTSMLGGNDIGSPIINGLQARYFIPPMLLILSTLNIKIIDLKFKNKEFIYAILILIIHMGVLTTIISGFYV